MTIRNSDIFRAMEKWAPKHLAYDWDNVGLQIGSFQKGVKKVMITLDVLDSVVDEAIHNNIDLIIAHHPLLFKPIKQVNIDSPQGTIIQKLIKHNISVYAAHTNLDIAEGGVNDILCDLLGVQDRKVLLKSHMDKLVKFAVFVPRTHAESVRNALGEQGAGFIGNYSHCTFQTEGQGTFLPLEGTNPYIGSQKKLEFVDEVKIETILPEHKLTQVIDVMMEAHPYEEPAYDVYPMENSGKHYGVGRIGTLNQGMTLKELGEHIKEKLSVPGLRITGDLSKNISKVAILGGSGEKYIHIAKQTGADVYITGDMTFHTSQDAWQMGLSVIDPGHHVEKVMKEATKKYLDDYFGEEQIDSIISQSNTEPFQFI